MKSFVLLVCLAQLWGCHSAPHGPQLPYRQPNCDDPETEQAALAAVDYLNRHLHHGYKHVLNQIDKVKVWSRRPFGELFELEVDTLESTCHVFDPTPLANCTVRQVIEHAVEGDCDFRVLKQYGRFSVVFAKCDSSADSAEDVRKVCLECPLLAQLNDTRVVHAVDAALAAFNAQNNGSYFQLVEISRAQLALFPASTHVEFAIAATDCAAMEVTDPTKCNLLAEKQYGFCKATVTESLRGEEVAVTCTVFQTQPAAPQHQPADPTASILAPVDQPAPMSPPDGPPAAAMVAGPMVVAAGPALPLHRVHYDLRHAFSGVASVESASGEAFHPGKVPEVTQPGVAGAVGPMVPSCPGRVRYFKI
ncbi:alpha-2-HS-glycoprotein [Nycticebus coucang]|uniref:alpha-2-HS-glycoprotein n=1 Tax=Nycticebus coucang TaxID=9470 RepID=UPI00234DDD24|nr:alpha-2-HS-glycoprotein [Nycticebus coucang]XP_053421259.1 alpha-2-HS-glycoprotein [Nycticebus coucang]XP_053421260.1 alpha-2-HS-glycoprotein [Nycticebus coucang]